jgi:hypothetical protein
MACEADGWYLRTNESQVSIPISRQLIKLPITPTLSACLRWESASAALFFACGGYWPMLVGALLSVWASILDGCDGEVARLKLLESDFGCWLGHRLRLSVLLVYLRWMTIGLAGAGMRERISSGSGFFLEQLQVSWLPDLDVIGLLPDALSSI